MEVTNNSEVKDFEVYNTPKFKFRVSSEWLDKGKENKKYPANIVTRIQKSMRQKLKYVTGQDWQESFEAIYEAITGNKFHIEEEED